MRQPTSDIGADTKMPPPNGLQPHSPWDLATVAAL